jgi:hypothetical protein
MNCRICWGAVLATALFATVLPARAGCLISEDRKAINVVTDNSATDEKSCNVTCRVETKNGPANISCGGTTPPLAKDHSLCDFDKPEPYYQKVISATGTCR